MIERARLDGIEASPWLALAALMYEDRQPWVERLAISEQVATEAVLVPMVAHPLYLADKHQQERWQQP